MAKVTTATYKQHASITSSIAFLPSLITAGFFLLALFMLYFETTALSTSLEERLPFELVRDEENGRLILSTLAAGTISLTVFSFSMVMIVLSQASSNLTPRVIPGLTTARSHQVVLGFNIGSIIYILLLLLSFKPQGGGTMHTPAIAILLGLVFGIVCLVLFVYFIHTISRAIQVDNILNSVFHQALGALQLEQDEVNQTHQPAHQPRDEFAFVVRNTQNGYLKEIDLAELERLAELHDLRMKILVEVGSFTVEGTPMLQLTHDPATVKGLCEQLGACLLISQDELVMKDYEQGLKLISEIAVKALSPGINDPGTAIKAVDFMTILFIRRMAWSERNSLVDSGQQVRVLERNITLDELLHRYLSPIRTYGKGDLQINIRLLRCFYSMLHQHPDAGKVEVIRSHAQAVASDAQTNLHNQLDKARLNVFLAELNELLPQDRHLEPLQV